jgi:succinate dehydrogenase/fumarate reductase flavoprotein subunit
MDVLGSGGRIRRENGDDIGPEEALEGEPCVLDLRGLDPDARSWFSQTSLRIRDRLGLDITRDVIPLSPGVAYTIGGAPCDQEGRVIFEGQNTGDESTSLWHTGLYAAGRSANTGMHGASPLPGNILLDDLVSGKAAGAHAATWAPINHFGGSDRIEQAVQEASNLISSIREGEGMTVGNFASKLSSAISTGPSSMEAAIAEIHDIKDSGIRLTDTSKVMNTEMVEALRLHGLASVAESIIASG